MRYIIGDLTVRLCSGIFHRIETIKQAAANYDYNPYLVTKPGMDIIVLMSHEILYYLRNHFYILLDPLAEELPPVTLEEYEALRENVSMVETKLMILKVSLQLQLADHSITGLPRQRKIVDSRVSTTCAIIRECNIYIIIINSFHIIWLDDTLNTCSYRRSFYEH